MDRKVEKIDSSHDRHTIRMQSATERDNMMRLCPWPKPTTHRLTYRWADDMTLVMEPELDPQYAPAPAVSKQQSISTNPSQPARTTPTPGSDLANRRLELDAMKDVDLVTHAAEIGVPPFKKGMSKAQKVAAVLKREQETGYKPVPTAASVEESGAGDDGGPGGGGVDDDDDPAHTDDPNG